MTFAALVAEAETGPATREELVARLVDAPEAELDRGRGRGGGALCAVEALEIGADPAADAGLGAGLVPVVWLAYYAL